MDYGAFFECGRGSYTTHNEHAVVSRGDGKLSYLGGGFTARYTNKADVYTEAGIHAGRMKNDAERVMIDELGNAYSYETHSNYWGINLGVGKKFRLSNTRDYDIYGTFYYNRMGGSSFTAGGAHYDLDAVNSELLRVGARYNHRLNEEAKLYAGLALDYEFGGKSGGTVGTGIVSECIRSSDTKGATGMLELGVELKAPESPWELNLGAKAYAGERKGFSGNLGIKYLC